MMGTSTGAACHQLEEAGVRSGSASSWPMWCACPRPKAASNSRCASSGVDRANQRARCNSSEERVMGRVALSVRRRRNAMRSRIALVVAAARSSAPAVARCGPDRNHPASPAQRPRQTAAMSRSANSPPESSPWAAEFDEPVEAPLLDRGDLGGDDGAVAEKVVEELL